MGKPTCDNPVRQQSDQKPAGPEVEQQMVSMTAVGRTGTFAKTAIRRIAGLREVIEKALKE
jgi:hypothetical protein